MVPTSRVKRIIEMAFVEARDDRSEVVETGHLLIALVREGQGIAAHALDDRQISLDMIWTEIGRLKASGMAEKSAHKDRPRLRLRQLDATDSSGRAIAVDVHLPLEYSQEDEDQLAARILKAVQGSEG